MSKGRNKHSAYYQFLEPFLESGNNEEIQKAKKEWFRKYKAEWRKAYRKKNKEFTISWTKEELKILSQEAKRHRLSKTRFIKKATMGYIDKRYIVPYQEEVNKTLQILAMIYNGIEDISKEGILPGNIAKDLQAVINRLEHDFRVAIFSPKTIEQVLSEVVKAKPGIKARLIQFIETL